MARGLKVGGAPRWKRERGAVHGCFRWFSVVAGRRLLVAGRLAVLAVTVPRLRR